MLEQARTLHAYERPRRPLFPYVMRCMHSEIACDLKWKSQRTLAPPRAVPRPPGIAARTLHRRHLRPRIAREHAVSSMSSGRRGVNGAPRQCHTYLRARTCAADLRHLLRTRSEARSPQSKPPFDDEMAWFQSQAWESEPRSVFTRRLHTARGVGTRTDARSGLHTSRPGRRAASAARRRRQSRHAHCRGRKPRPRHHVDKMRPVGRCRCAQG